MPVRGKKVGKCKPNGKKWKIGNKTYTKSSCHNTKAAAQKEAARLRAEGRNARTRYDKALDKTCVYKYGSAKKTTKKSTSKKKKK
ncbi:MAG: hypothetical protein ACPG5B_06815 [Chitinophagales bacterium]